jgi:hypothetical protein
MQFRLGKLPPRIASKESYYGQCANPTPQSASPIHPASTWAGHDLLHTLRSKTVWQRIKTTAKDKGIELTFDAVKSLGKVAVDWVIAN